MPIDDRTEWLEADGLGGFASGTSSGVRTRRYHGLLLAATTPPTGRMMLVNGFDAWMESRGGTFALSTQQYAPGVRHPDGASRIAAFTPEPWPSWTFECADGTCLRQEILVPHQTGLVLVCWRVVRAEGEVVLRVRPFLSGRDYHSLQRENDAFRFEPRRHGALLEFHAYDGVPAVRSLSNGEYRHAPEWYRQFLYSAERERGLDCVEDLASPGELTWRLSGPDAQAVWLLQASLADDPADPTPAGGSEPGDAVALADVMRARERSRRAGFPTALDRAADAYIVRRGSGRTIIAGYPWFTDWGRDTFIAVRGLCLAAGRVADARDILIAWADAVSEGMLPNRFPDRGEAPEFNSVDASLWYVVAVSELLVHPAAGSSLGGNERGALESAVRRIVAGYAGGTRYGIRMDDDGLLAAGVAGVQLTWMDARVGDRVITPRVGKPVEIQALWVNALHAASQLDSRWRGPLERAREAFAGRFWIEEEGCLADVVDVDHVPGTRDTAFRPNQILAVGGLPIPLVTGERARRVVDAVERRLLTPLGLRSLAPGLPGYTPRYEGDPAARDAAYHQGTVWPWLAGPFVEAWVRVRGNTAAARREARVRFLPPLLAHLEEAGLGHVSEIADAEHPFTPAGCPFQAWSAGELLRLDRVVLASASASASASGKRGRREPKRELSGSATS